MTPRLTTLDHFVLTVADIPTTLRFYEQVLGMIPTPFIVADGTTRHALRIGDMKINLHQKGSEFEPKAGHVQSGSADLCFRTDTPLAEWQTHLARAGIEVEIGPVPRTGATGTIISLYIRDPDRNLIEVSTKA